MPKPNPIIENSIVRGENSGPDSPEYASLPHVVILADDLTGACDSAASFLGEGRRVRVWLQRDGFDSLPDAEVWSFSSESRNQSASAAVQGVKSISEELHGQFPSAIFFKKVDSAGRGHSGAESEAARLAVDADITIYAPAFPATGRTVLNGVLHTSDATGKSSELRLQELFPVEMRDGIALISCGTDIEVKRRLLSAIEEGRHVLICDAASIDDLGRIVRVARTLTKRLLWAGSAGLACELAAELQPAVQGANNIVARRSGKTLLVCGTPHPLTRLQMDRLRRAKSDIQTNCVVVQARCGVSSDDKLRQMFSGAGEIGSLVLTGGDTAAMVLRALEARSIVMGGEMATGVPWGILQGGLADGCIAVTKSGGFGDEDVLVNALYFCRGVAS